METLFILFIIGCIFGFHVPFILIGAAIAFCFFVNLAHGLMDWFERVWE